MPKTPAGASASRRRSPMNSWKSEIEFLLTSGNHIWEQASDHVLTWTFRPGFCGRTTTPANATRKPESFIGSSHRGVKGRNPEPPGRVFMPTLDCPFTVGRFGQSNRSDREAKVILVDVHAESHIGETGPGLVSGRPGERHHRHPHPRSDRGRTDPAERAPPTSPTWG